MNKAMLSALAAVAAGGVVSSAQAAVVNAVITADNHYAIFRTTGMGIELVNGNELGGGGSPGDYNWSNPESFTFESDGPIFIAAWSDDNTAQGLLAQITIDGVNYSTGHPAWQVTPTYVDLDDNNAYPTAVDVTIAVALATFLNTWESTYVGATNASAPSPWGQIPGIDGSAQWIWRANPAGGSPFTPGLDLGEFLIFTIPVPTPGMSSLVLIAAGMMMPIRRR